jgi:hypothetical protein
MEFKEQLRYYSINAGEHLPQLILAAAISSKSLYVQDKKLEAFLVALDMSEYVYNIVERGKSPLDARYLYAQVSVNPVADLNVRIVRGNPTLKEIPEEILEKLIK